MVKVPNLYGNKNDNESFNSDTKFYESVIAGLSVQVGDSPERDEQPELVRFTPYEFFDEEKGEQYVKGYLATDEKDAIEVLSEDPNVSEISKEDYEKAVKDGKRAKY